MRHPFELTSAELENLDFEELLTNEEAANVGGGDWEFWKKYFSAYRERLKEKLELLDPRQGEVTTQAACGPEVGGDPPCPSI